MNPLVTVPAVAFLGLVSTWQLYRRSSKPALGDDKGEKKEEEKKDGEDKKNDEKKKEVALPVTDPNWQWPIYDQFIDKRGNTLKKREGKGEEGENGPFRVIYRTQKLQQWPDAVQITLYSRPLCDIIAQYLPDNGDLKTLAEPTVDGRELWIVLEQLKYHKFSSDGGAEPDHHGPANGNGALEHHGLANGDSIITDELTNGDAGQKLANGESIKIDELTNGDAGQKLANGDSVRTDELTTGDASQEDPKAKKEVDEGELHLKHLVRFMDKEYRDLAPRVKRMVEEQKAAWDLLWAFLPPGRKVVYNCDHSEELLYATTSKNFFEWSFREGCWFFTVEIEIWEFDTRSFRKCPISRRIRKYEGERSFSSLPVRPVELLGTPEAWEERFLENGKKYSELTIEHAHRFMHYTGPMFIQRKNETRGCWVLHKESADGRVMIDLASFAKMNPFYPMGNARPPTASRSLTVRADGSYNVSSSCCVDTLDSSGSEVWDENLMFAPGIVYGFSFSLKLWGSFAINGFLDIAFDSSAFNQLVMEPQTKSLVHNLVSHYIGTPAVGSTPLQRVDPISNKGNGCVFLCYGPPGTGKTLTAESLAETMRRPLWSLSVSELGTTPKDLEQTLFKVLDIAAAWRAVLLLDEADVYLERRQAGGDITRNAMTGIFLRMLEYYRGVLFLTTNRIETFDEAFRSRISMFLHYTALSTDHKAQIWRALLDRTQIRSVSSEKLLELAELDLNGREIRNAIHTAQSWAQSKGEPLELEHVQYVMEVVASSLKSLTEALQDSSSK